MGGLGNVGLMLGRTGGTQVKLGAGRRKAGGGTPPAKLEFFPGVLLSKTVYVHEGRSTITISLRLHTILSNSQKRRSLSLPCTSLAQAWNANHAGFIKALFIAQHSPVLCSQKKWYVVQLFLLLFVFVVCMGVNVSERECWGGGVFIRAVL